MKENHLQVEAIRNGTVLDHIPSDVLFQIVALLGLEQFSAPVTIGNNFESKRIGRKGIIKMTDRYFTQEELSRITILAPDVRVNVIKDYKVVEKQVLSLPKEVVGLVRCPNPRCITSSEPMPTRFSVLRRGEGVQLTCDYCARQLESQQAELL